jgi:hypothetical protein
LLVVFAWSWIKAGTHAQLLLGVSRLVSGVLYVYSAWRLLSRRVVLTARYCLLAKCVRVVLSWPNIGYIFHIQPDPAAESTVLYDFEHSSILKERQVHIAGRLKEATAML